MILPLLMLAQSAAATPPPPPADIIVTGTRARVPDKAPLGSRIARPAEADPRGFVSQIASDTGVAGLDPGSGMDPFAGGTRRITVKSCRSSDKALSPAAMCALAAISRRLEGGDLAGARAAVGRFVERADIGPADRYAAWQFAYRAAAEAADERGRADALTAMLASEAMPTKDALAARRMLATLALRRGDEVAALAQYGEVARLVRGDTRSRANLAALHARSGRHGEARVWMAEAVRLAVEAGQAVPREWHEYLERPRQRPAIAAPR